QSVDTKDLVRSREPDISTALAGKVAGVQFQGSPSSGFGNSTIRVRGNTGVSFVVDGIRVGASVDVSTEDIENISILKGAAATALYGPTAGNGVVVITTKSAKSGQSSVAVNYSTSFDQLYLLPTYQNEYGGGYNQASNNPDTFDTYNGEPIPQYYADESWGPKLDGRMVRHWDSWIPGDAEFGKLRAWSPQPDNVREFFQTGITNNVSLTFSKGGEDYSVRSNITNIDRDLIYTNAQRKQVNASINASYDINKNLKAYAFANFQDRRTRNSPDNGYNTNISNFNQWWQRQLDMDRLRRYRRDGKIVSWNMKGPTDPSPLYWDSPFFEVYENVNFQTKNALYGKVGLTFTVNDDLNASIEVRKTMNSYEYNNRTAFGGLNQEGYSESENISSTDEIFGVINYDKDITEDIDVNASVGFETNDYNYKSIAGSSVGGLTTLDFYSLATSKDRPNVSSSRSRSKRNSVFARASFGYKNILFVDGTARYDWQSTANPADNRVDTYGASTSFIFSKLLPQNNILSFGKLRASFAEAPSFPGTYANNITYGNGTAYGSYGAQTISGTYPNPLLIGGKKSEWEIGTEMKFFGSRVGIDITYFEKTNKELPSSVTLDGSTGYTSTVSNDGQDSYKGLEYTLFANPIKTELIDWSFNINFATLNRWTDAIADGITRNTIGGTWGMSVLAETGQEYGAIYGRKYRRDADNNILLNSLGAPLYDTNQYLGNFLPDFTGGMSNNVRIGDFNVGFDIDFQKGGKIYSVSRMFGAYSGVLDITTTDNKLGNPQRNVLTRADGAAVSNYRVNADDAGADSGGVYVEGVSSTTGLPIAYYVNPYRYYKSLYALTEAWLFDNTYVKLRTLRVDYNLPKSILKKTPFKDVNIGVYGNNVWMIYTSVPNTDVSEIGNGYAESGQNPNVRTFGLNVKLTF
ncbi:TonB-dependent receptor plug domain-containing protein, partial [Winogradskyella sp.]|uniref:TonB-dependent receptor plug domain-containing protein n=1 Tax=Winogradskyella sp. TaxID=1883156 RepID=UPI003AA96713